MTRDFLITSDLTRAELDQLIESALRFKQLADQSKPLAGKSIALVFFNPSLRTRASMQVGIYELGGNAVVLEPGGTFIGKVFAGGADTSLVTELKRNFRTVKHAKPPASRKDSSELYVVALGLKGRPPA